MFVRLGVIFVCATASTMVCSWSNDAKAFGKFGHLTVCDLAYRNLTDASRDEIRGILRSGRSTGITVPARANTASRRYTSFNMGCLEEDELPRRNPNHHFLNLPRTVRSVTNASCPPQADGECILAGIQRDFEILKDRSRSQSERAFALFALGHWIGDIHQPLHISFADDRGGNGVEARVSGGCGRFGYYADELHGVWDNCILHKGTFERVRRRADYKPSWSRWTVTYRAVDTLLANTSLAAERQIVTGEPWQWANESYQIALDPAVRYCLRVGESCNYSSSAVTLQSGGTRRREQLDQTYLQAFDRVVEDRIRFAGFRLAHLLNTALDPTYAGPSRDGMQPE